MTEQGWREYATDFAALLVTLLIIGAYQFYTRQLARRSESLVLSAVAIHARSMWVATLMASKDSGILAIQTLRNSTMAATFLASTAVLLVIGVLTLSAQGAGLSGSWHALNIVGSIGPEVWSVKLLGMLLVLFFAFFSFTNAIRIFNIVGYMINARNKDGAATFTPQVVADELNRGGRYFSNGMRAYYYMIPLVCWLFGPLYMVGAAIMLATTMLPLVDRLPRTDGISRDY